MPGYHLNGMITRASMGMEGKPFPYWIACTAPCCGSLLIVSTREQSFPLFQVWWSLERYQGGPVPRTWQCMGSIRDMYGYNLEHPGGLLGPDYVELWVMRNYHRGCDLYMRRSTVIPREQFSHFSINVSDPAFFLRHRGGSMSGRQSTPSGRLPFHLVYRVQVIGCAGCYYAGVADLASCAALLGCRSSGTS